MAANILRSPVRIWKGRFLRAGPLLRGPLKRLSRIMFSIRTCGASIASPPFSSDRGSLDVCDKMRHLARTRRAQEAEAELRKLTSCTLDGVDARRRVTQPVSSVRPYGARHPESSSHLCSAGHVSSQPAPRPCWCCHLACRLQCMSTASQHQGRVSWVAGAVHGPLLS